MRKYSLGHVARRYLRTYLTVCIIPLLFAGITYLIAINTTTSQSQSLLMKEQNIIMNTLEDCLADMDDLALNMYLDYDIDALTRIDTVSMEPHDVRKMITVYNNAEYYHISNLLVDSFIYIVPRNEVLFDGSEVLTSPRPWYENRYQLEDVTYDEWLAELISLDSKKGYSLHQVTTGIITKNIVQYAVPLRNGSVLIYRIDEDRLHDLLCSTQLSGSISALYCDDNQLLYASDAAFRFPDLDLTGSMGTFSHDGFLYAYAVGPKSGWMTVTQVPAVTALGPVRQLKIIVYLLLLMTLIGGGMWIVHLAKRTAHPVDELLTLLGMDSASYQPEMLKNSVSHLLMNNHQLQEQLAQQRQHQQSLILERALSGSVQDPAQDLLPITGLQLRVSVVCLPADVSVAYADICARDCLNNMDETEFLCLTHLFRRNELVLVSGCVQGDEQYQRDLLSRFLDQLLPMLPGTRIGISKPVQGINDIRSGYRGAKSVLAGSPDSTGVCFAEDVTFQPQSFTYSLNTEFQLVNAVSSGDESTVQTLLDKIRLDNFDNNLLSPEMQRCLLMNFYCTYLKCAKNEASDMLHHLEDSGANHRILFDRLCSLFLQLTASQAPASEPVDSRASVMIEYISQHYAEYSLDVSRMAEEFHLSPNYFSQYFKEKVGENFASYLEKYRLLQANSLLLSSSMTIEQIAESVGYSSVYTFRRAYKRVMGISPGEQRTAAQRLCSGKE